MGSFAAYFVWRLLQKETLGQLRRRRQAGRLHDEIKTALVVQSTIPAHRSGWTAQLQRAAEALGARSGTLFPRSFPARFILRPMILVFVALIFLVPAAVESQLAHTSAAPAFSLTDKEEAALNRPWSSQKGRKAPEDRAWRRIETSAAAPAGQDRRVPGGEMLNDVQSKLDEGNLDLGSSTTGSRRSPRISRVQT